MLLLAPWAFLQAKWTPGGSVLGSGWFRPGEHCNCPPLGNAYGALQVLKRSKSLATAQKKRTGITGHSGLPLKGGGLVWSGPPPLQSTGNSSTLYIFLTSTLNGTDATYSSCKESKRCMTKWVAILLVSFGDHFAHFLCQLSSVGGYEWVGKWRVASRSSSICKYNPNYSLQN